jgi:mRNA-degrading endonuclease RelE of RelBE toxin-antitoxin system
VPYRIEYTATARRSLKTVRAFYRAWARREIEALAAYPCPPRAQELRDRPGRYRIHLNRWRMIYRVEDDSRIVRILDIRLKTGPETHEGLDELE